MATIEKFDNKLLLHVVIAPKASRDEVVGLLGEELKIAITAPPVDGKANIHICKYLSKLFKTAKSNIKILKGLTGKHKTIEILNYTNIPEDIIKYDKS